jgi:HD domain
MWSPNEARDLASSYLGTNSARWAHVVATARNAECLVEAGHASEVLTCAAWLHDIGYSPKLARTGMHAIDGARFLDLLGAPSLLVGLVAFHTGAEFEADERGLTGPLLEFDRPDQGLLDLLILADLVSSPTGEAVSVDVRLTEILDRYEPQHPVHRAVSRSRHYLESAAIRATARAGYPMWGTVRSSSA